MSTTKGTMQSTTVNIGQEVWITGGLDKDKKGTVVGGGFGVYQVELDSETKTFDRTNVSTTNPKSHAVPLPPNFIPSDFKMGELVEVHGHSGSYDGIKGKVVRLPTSTSHRTGDPRYAIEVTGKGNKSFEIGHRLHFEPHNLRTPVKKARIVGDEISHEDVQIGDKIRTEIRSTDGNYSQLSSKEGRVSRITKRLNASGLEPWAIYSFGSDRHHGLTFGNRDEKIILLEAAVDPYIAIVEGLASGSVVTHERESGTVLTYVKSVPFLAQSQWHVISSHSNRSSTFVDDQEIIEALNNGAEIVHKVRKPAKQVVPPPPPF